MVNLTISMQLSIGSKAPDVCQAIIEIPKGSNNKYEFDKESGIVKLDRVLSVPMFYPADYGFFPETLGGDGDPIDVMVLTTNPLHPGVALDVRPIGYLMMIDKGEQDEKILAVPKDDVRFAHINEIADVPQHTLDEIAFFFQYYKTLEKKEVKLEGWKGAAEAKQVLVDAMARAKQA